MTQTLLDKAIAEKGIRGVRSPEEIELALAWATNEISMAQVSRAINVSSASSTYLFLATALRKYIQSQKK